MESTIIGPEEGIPVLALGGGWSEVERLTSAQLVDDDAERLQRVVKVQR